MNVISLFDGMSCGMIALKRAGIQVDKYYASEIDKAAILVSQSNYPEIIRLGDVTKVAAPDADLLIGGSPCQGFSFAGKQLNVEDHRSKLFFEYVRILEELRKRNPNVLFLLENVKMKQAHKDVISERLGVQPIEINSALVSAQNRKRLYWTNIPNVTQPVDKGILLKDAIPVTYTVTRTEEAKLIRKNSKHTHGRDFSPRSGQDLIPRKDDKSNCLTAVHSGKQHLVLTKKALDYMDRIVSGGRTHWDFKHHSYVHNDESSAVVANFFKGVPYNVLKDFDCIRAFDPIECERLKTVPEGYTGAAPKTQRLKMLGNGWTVDVISHIFKHIIQ